jgi:hypothetical protein
MRQARQVLWTSLGFVTVAVASLLAGMYLAAPAAPRTDERLAHDVALLRDALDRYRADHGWYPCDAERDYNSAGNAALLRRQLTEFTRDDGKPSARHDGEYRLGPYLRNFPADARHGSRAVVIDQDQARALTRFTADVSAGNGAGGWYYEARTGNITANDGRGRARPPVTQQAGF